MSDKVKVKLTKTITATVEIDNPQGFDNDIEWYDAVQEAAFQAHDGAWTDWEDEAEILEGEWVKPG